MIAACAYHLMYLLVGRPFSTAMLPKLRDIGDFMKDMKHTFHLSKESPKFDRFSYRNKAAYWLAYPGAVVMIGTGLILLYPAGTTRHLPGWTLPLALIIHSDAAILAIGWIVLVHMYFAHFSRHTFPLDKAVFTGKVPIEVQGGVPPGVRQDRRFFPGRSPSSRRAGADSSATGTVRGRGVAGGGVAGQGVAGRGPPVHGSVCVGHRDTGKASFRQ